MRREPDTDDWREENLFGENPTQIRVRPEMLRRWVRGGLPYQEIARRIGINKRSVLRYYRRCGLDWSALRHEALQKAPAAPGEAQPEARGRLAVSASEDAKRRL